MTALHRYDITAAQWLPPREPAFIAKATTNYRVSFGVNEFDAYVLIDGVNADIPILLGLYDYQTEQYMDADQAADAFGVPQIKLWEGDCPPWADEYDEAWNRKEGRME